MKLDTIIEAFWTVVFGFLLVQYVGVPVSNFVKETITGKPAHKELILR